MRDPMPQPRYTLTDAEALQADMDATLKGLKEESIFSWNKWDTRDAVLQVTWSMLGSFIGVVTAGYMFGLLP